MITANIRSPSVSLPMPGSWIYLMGICGTGMAALAGLLLERGYRVTGSDSGCYPPMSELLDSLGIDVIYGYSTDNLDIAGTWPDCVIIGNVIRADNPEAVQVMKSGIPYLSFPAALASMFLHERISLVVAGTHGKTTTSSMLVAGLRGCGFDPGFMIGGILHSDRTGFRAGAPPWFVLEGDEYDTAFFDKGPKFLHYRPYGLILTSIEFDHADIFQDICEVKSAFAELVESMPEDGIIAACRDWHDVRDVCVKARCRVIWYGTDTYEVDWQAQDVVITGEGTNFVALGPEGERCDVSICQPGLHNALDALGVIALCSELGLDKEKIVAGLAEGRGVMRRQEIKFIANGVKVIDDFAHHPRAVMETLAGLRPIAGQHRLIALFEPRTNTSRRGVFQQRYAESFEMADMVLVRDVPEPDKAPEGDRFSSEELVNDLNLRGINAMLFPDGIAMADYLSSARFKEGDIIVTLSNGAFDNIHSHLRKVLS